MRERQRSRISSGPIATIVLAVIALACIASTLSLRSFYAARQDPFAAVCTATRVGAPIADVEAAFARIGERASMHGWRSGESAPYTTAWFRRTGLSRWQQCTVEVEPSTQRVVRARTEAGTDFTRCSNRVGYPRRHWLCRLADAVAP